MADMVRAFALKLIRRLRQNPPTNDSTTKGVIDGMEDGEMPQEEEIKTEYLPGRVEIPADKHIVLQHVELVFSLSAKSPEFLDE